MVDLIKLVKQWTLYDPLIFISIAMLLKHHSYYYYYYFKLKEAFD
jgi:hypothetical protein